jgi:hypothetical protein
MKRVLIAAVCLAAVPALANAQACFGTPTRDGQWGIRGSLGLASGAKAYGAEVNADLAGPLSIGAGYTMIDLDDTSTNGNSFGGGVAFELAVPNVSMCPTARVVYNRVHEEGFGAEATVNQVIVPIGFGIGKVFPAGSNFNVVLFGEPQFLYIRSSVDASSGLGSISGSETDNQFGADLGVRLSGASFFAGASVSLTTIEDSDPVFEFTLGVLVGKKR